MKWIIGLNGSGKTVYLDNQIDEYKKKGSTIENVRNTKQYSGFDEHRIALLEEMENYDIITNYGELRVINNKLEIITDGITYTEYFFNLITLLCRKGDYLILDEPEFGLYGMELSSLVEILMTLLPTYKDGIIATHCQKLLCIEPNNFYWCKDYKLTKIAEENLYEHIGQF